MIRKEDLLLPVGKKIREIIGNMKCPVHDRISEVEVSIGEGGKINLNVQSCCDDFNNAILEKIHSLSDNNI